MAKVNLTARHWLWIVFNFCCLMSFASFAQNSQHNLTEIKYYKPDNVTNSIPLLENRFRIDETLSEITMIFYHRVGAKPVILVQPDGSKIRVNDYDKEQVAWYDDSTYDMIKIKKPMPGPWQAVGDILPNSEILVISDVKIVVPPLPKVMLSGETIKVEGRLVNGDTPITNHLFRNIVELKVLFVSTNNSAYHNFGAETVELTRFRDDGRDLDEHKNDGIFTGEFKLTIPSGEWIPIYKIDLPMTKRELKQKPVMVQPNPIKITVDIAKDKHKFHVVHFNIDSTYVDPKSLIFQGKITFPDKQSSPFSITDGEGLVKDTNGKISTTERIKKFGYTEPGIHRIDVSVFGKTINGREFRLVVPEFTFNVERTKQQLLAHISEVNSETPLVDVKKQTEQAQQKLLAEQQQQQQEIEQQQKQRWIIIASINFGILLAALIVFLVIRKRATK